MVPYTTSLHTAPVVVINNEKFVLNVKEGTKEAEGRLEEKDEKDCETKTGGTKVEKGEGDKNEDDDEDPYGWLTKLGQGSSG